MPETGSQAFVKIYFENFQCCFSGSGNVSEFLKHFET